MFFGVTASALGPASHIYDVREYFRADNWVTRKCKSYYAEFRAGAIAVDWSVYGYVREYEQGIDSGYARTHNWLFIDRMYNSAETAAEECFALGAAIGHGGPDIASHNEIVPSYIRAWSLKNIPAHWAAEGAVEAWVSENCPECTREAHEALDMLMPGSASYNPRLVQLMEGASADPKLDILSSIKRLDGDIGLFYEQAFRVDLADFVSKLARAYAGSVDIQGALSRGLYYMDWLTDHYSSRSAYEIHGFTELKKADDGVKGFLGGVINIPSTIIMIMVVGVIVLAVRRR